ncbi:FadR/GntR family transcriptional regulator [Clostridiisalibacter paucivorans]|uniref:FadR/GntR family transcriptional regulator n=1 Tax=Clostridiisalibacter paucivorans TaxID=408753 RepID=UPI000479B29E|nr:FadR/GntR family transcriptional regulator [Clostridiisalibacter paucivorans]
MFKPIKSKKIYEYVVEQIQQMIVNGDLKSGDKLPSERELAERLKVSRTSIREALRALEVLGLIESRQGEGNFIKESLDNGFFQPLSVMFMLNKDNPSDILELRIAIEVEAASLAARRINDEDIQELEELMDKLIESDDEKYSAKYDTEIHYKIASVTKNYLIINLLNGISSLIETFIKNARESILRENEEKDILIKQHRKICDALIERDPDKAASAMREHLIFVNDYLKNL